VGADAALAEVTVVVVDVEFIEVGPISVVLNGVSALPPDGADSYPAPGFSGPGGAAGPSYGAFRSAAGETGIEKLGL
jgi:hypothetical protein